MSQAEGGLPLSPTLSARFAAGECREAPSVLRERGSGLAFSVWLRSLVT